MLEIERALAAREIEVTTVTTDDDGAGRTLSFPCWRPIEGVAATRWYFRRNTVFYKVSLSLARWLKTNIRSFDIVHAHGLFSFAPVAAAFAARRTGIPYVLRPYGVLDRYGMTNRRPWLKKLSFSLIERRLIESASAVHFTSRLEQLEAEVLGMRCNSVIIPLGIGFDTWAQIQRDCAKKPGSRIKLLFLSRIDPKKNVEGLLRALSLVAKRRQDFVLCIAGNGDADYVDGLKSLAGELGLAHLVQWHGFVDGEEKQAVLAKADAFVLPSFSENFGIAVVEGLAAGLPCIVSDNVAVHDDISLAAAGIVVGTDPGSIAVGIERFLNDRGSHLTMSRAARELAAKKFSSETMGQRLEALYRDCLRTKPASAVSLQPELVKTAPVSRWVK